MSIAVHWIDALVLWITRQATPETMFSQEAVVRALFALILVGIVAGAVGSLVVCNRMAFFSDALAHCAFSGVALGLLAALVLHIDSETFHQWITLIMVGWGVLVGVLIAYVHEKTLLPGDTVIGVFFAGALGLGAIFTRAVRERRFFNLESFIFGDPMVVRAEDLVWLFALLILTILFLIFWYNPLLFGSFNPSLARSRRVPSRLALYLFIVLLGIIVNLCQQAVGILLINGLLIVPGATASYLSRNLRQLLWWSVGIAVFCGVAGLWLSWEISARYSLNLGIGGTVLVLSVVIFAFAMVARPIVRRS